MKKTKRNANNKPYLSKILIIYLAFWGSTAERMREPSNGGIGTKLNTAKTKFVKTTISRARIAGPGKLLAKNLTISPATRAKTILDNGPAIATKASPFLPDFKALKLTGTGFAQPIMIPVWEMAQSRGNIIDPNISKCFIGFKVRRPIILAV